MTAPRRGSLRIALCVWATMGLCFWPGQDPRAQPRAAEGGRVEELSLAVGETRTISARDVRNYSLSMSDVVEARLTPDNAQFLVVGKRAGNTTLLLIKNDGTQITYDIEVSQRSLSAIERELQQLLEGETGVRYRRIGGRFFLEGSVGTEAELHRLQQLAALYPGQVENLVTVGGGTATDRKMLIRVDFFFVQYDANSSYAVGLAWPATVGGAAVLQNTITYDFVARTTTTAQASVVNQPLPSLDIASQHGWAKVLRQASVLTSNGTEANFDSGGEQNFSANTGLTVGVQRIVFGTNVTVLPRYDSGSGQIDVKVVSDISDLTAPVSGSLPGRIFSKLTTNVALKLGQGLVLSGLNSQTHNHSVTGLPLLSSIPVIGLLFASHADTETATENAMFIIPSVVETVPRSAQSMIGAALKEYHNFSGDMRGVNSELAIPSQR
jgi:pilus assembly protein CpaC